MENDENLLVYSFPKGQGEEIHATIRRYRGKYFADLRLWYQAKNENMFLPTKKGISITLDKIHELRKAVERLSKASEKYRDREALEV